MTDNVIIKALESVKKNPTPFSLEDKVMIASLDLINRLKAKNKELDEKIVIQMGTIGWQTKEINRQKAEIAKLEKVEKYADETIKTQAAEIERLKSYNKTCGEIIGEQEIELATAKAEAIKEFAERLKIETFECDVSFGYGKECYQQAVAVIEIDNLVKEMTEDENENH